jgi:VIT1/CCC1 family predicted Fe2+/Mn2+ transporter
MTIDRQTAASWLEHWQDEADAAFLYRVLADAERVAERRELYRRLADVEERHTELWRKLLADEGIPCGTPQPTRRARLLAWTARRFGPGLLTTLLLKEEGREVKGYLALYKDTAPSAAKDTALTLAKESAEHAETLGVLAGQSGEPWHQMESGGFVRNVVYGFNDGLTANFGLVAGVIGASVAPQVVLLSGVAGMVADALSMGSSGYLAAKSEQEVYEHEIAMEADEIRLMPEVETDELALVYEAKGVAPDEARRMATDVMKDPAKALAEEVREELKIGAQHSTPLREGWITGASTAVGAFIPVAPFLVLHGAWAIWTAFAIAMLSHFAVGAARSVFTGRGIFRSGLDMFVVGLGVAAVAYLVGGLISRLLS